MKQVFDIAVGKLEELYPSGEAREIIFRLLESLTGLKPAFLFIDNKELSAKQTVDFAEMMRSLMDHQPLQYVLGEAHFYGMEFGVQPGVLIPRPETEELVQWVLATVPSNEGRLLDIGTGSGCIAITMALQLPFWDITALDVSEEALIQARSNALRHKANVKFQTVDVLNWETYPIFENSRWDVIVSNPPYVTESERASMRENVLRFEPEIALFVDDENPLVFYETIARLARLSLNEGGFLFFEINEHFGNEVAALLESLGFIEVVIANDIFRKARMVRGIKPKV